MWSETTAEMLPTATVPFRPFVNPALFTLTWIFMVTVGFSCTGYFFIYLVSTPLKARSLTKEVAIAAVSSVFLGYGCLFLLLWGGVWV